MADPARREDEWERKQAVAAAMVDFLEGWVIIDLCTRFRTVAEALYSETPEQRLLIALLEDSRPLSLRQIGSKCSVSRALLLPDGRLRRAVERLERSGIVSKSQRKGDEKPRYSLNRRNLTSQLLAKVFAEDNREGGLAAASLRESLGS
jgi:hypothetical protein